MKKIDKLLLNIGIEDHLTATKIKYGLEVVKTELSKTIVLLIFFTLLDKTSLFVFTLIILAPLRCFSGGLHLQNKYSCFALSFSIFIVALVILPMWSIMIEIYYCILIFGVVIIYILSPIFSNKRPIETKERYLYLRKRSIQALLLSTSLVIIMPLVGQMELFISGTWIMAIQALQLIIAKFINKRGGKTNEISY